MNSQYYCDVLLSQQMLPAIKRVTECCLFAKQYVAYGEIGHFLCSVISQGKIVALDRWGGKWNHLSMTYRLTTNYAKNYCNRTLIVKVIVENVVTCFLGHSVYDNRECICELKINTFGQITICAKTSYIFVHSDLGLWHIDVKFAPLVTLLQRYVSTKLAVSIRLSYFQKIGGMRRTDGWLQRLMRPPREGRVINFVIIIFHLL